MLGDARLALLQSYGWDQRVPPDLRAWADRAGGCRPLLPWILAPVDYETVIAGIRKRAFRGEQMTKAHGIEAATDGGVLCTV